MEDGIDRYLTREPIVLFDNWKKGGTANLNSIRPFIGEWGFLFF
jgi:hypothetical protein